MESMKCLRCLPMNNNREKIESKMNKMMEMEILIEKNNGKVLILELMICLKELKITRKEEIGKDDRMNRFTVELTMEDTKQGMHKGKILEITLLDTILLSHTSLEIKMEDLL